MTYEAFSRKYRPKDFSQVIGQDYIVKILKNALKLNRISHAYIFAGSRGVGKTTVARILTKALNCKNPVDYEPCNRCENCIEIEKGSFPDMYEIDAASNRGIDDIRSIRDNVGYAPIKGKYKVYIIDEVHMLTKEAFNALLKTLEEPPPKNIFILATTELYKIPDTIKSRCQIFLFKQPTKGQIKTYLTKILKDENIPYEEEALEILLEESDGGMRDYASLLDQAVTFSGEKLTTKAVEELLGVIPKEYLKRTLICIRDQKIQEAIKIVEKIEEDGFDLNIFWKQITDSLHNELINIVLNEKGDIFQPEDIKKLIYILSLFNKGAIESKNALNPKSIYQLYILKLKYIDYIKPLEQLVQGKVEIESKENSPINSDKIENTEVSKQQEINKIYRILKSEPLLSNLVSKSIIENLEDRIVLKTSDPSVGEILETKKDTLENLLRKKIFVNYPKNKEVTKKDKNRDKSIDHVLQLFPGSKIVKYEEKEE